MHQEIHLQVNAWVDEGIAPLVAALNRFERIVTVDSCQGDESQPAYVYFKEHPDSSGLALFVQDLAEILRDCDLRCDYTLRVEWLGEDLEPMAQILALPSSIQLLADALTKAVNSRHTSASGCDKVGTAPRS